MNIQDIISGAVGSQATEGISQKLGLDQDKTQFIVASAIPLMVSALNYNAGKDEEKANQINNALSKHDGSIFNQISGLFDQGPTDEDNRIVNHMFGKNTGQVTESLALKTGLSSEKVSAVLAMLAPIVMGFLGKQNSAQTGSGGIGDLLGGLLGGSSTGSALQGGLGGLLGSILGGGNSADTTPKSTSGSITDLVGDFFNKSNDSNAKGNILDTLAGMFKK